jgi:hypothetical protein
MFGINNNDDDDDDDDDDRGEMHVNSSPTGKKYSKTQ